MLKFTFITDEATQEPADFIRLARDHRLGAVELRTVHDQHCSVLGDAERVALKRQLKEAQLDVCCIDSSVFKADLVDDLAADFEKLRKALVTANDLDAPYVRIFSFWRVPADTSRIQCILRAIALAVDMAAEAGKTLLVENGKRTSHATGAELALLMRQVPHNALRALWDPANSLYGGTDSDPLGHGFELVQPYMRHVHLKQVHRHPEEDKLCYGPLPGGALDIDRFLSQLVTSDYDGYVSMETHWRPDRWFTEQELDYPGGKQFSTDGWRATSDSLRFLSERIHAVT